MSLSATGVAESVTELFAVPAFVTFTINAFEPLCTCRGALVMVKVALLLFALAVVQPVRLFSKLPLVINACGPAAKAVPLVVNEAKVVGLDPMVELK